MAGVLLLVLFFMLHLVVIITEKGRRCWVEKKFWASVVFVMFLIGIAVYGNSCSRQAESKPAQSQSN
jgi:hypothetical protein